MLFQNVVSSAKIQLDEERKKKIIQKKNQKLCAKELETIKNPPDSPRRKVKDLEDNYKTLFQNLDLQLELAKNEISKVQQKNVNNEVALLVMNDPDYIPDSKTSTLSHSNSIKSELNDTPKIEEIQTSQPTIQFQLNPETEIREKLQVSNEPPSIIYPEPSKRSAYHPNSKTCTSGTSVILVEEKQNFFESKVTSNASGVCNSNCHCKKCQTGRYIQNLVKYRNLSCKSTIKLSPSLKSCCYAEKNRVFDFNFPKVNSSKKYRKVFRTQRRVMYALRIADRALILQPSAGNYTTTDKPYRSVNRIVTVYEKLTSTYNLSNPIQVVNFGRWIYWKNRGIMQDPKLALANQLHLDRLQQQKLRNIFKNIDVRKYDPKVCLKDQKQAQD